MRGDPPPSRKAGQAIAAPLTAGTPSNSRPAGRRQEDDSNIVLANTLPAHHGRQDLDNETYIARCITAREGSRQDWETETLIAHTLRAEGHDASEDGTGRGTPLVAFAQNQREEVRELTVAGSLSTIRRGDAKNETLLAHEPLGAIARSAVRRLTPRECERLQGFVDDYTLITYRGKPARDGPRYAKLGNSMAVTCMQWLGRRIELVESVLLELSVTRGK
jgi:DNA (cytosine-5)-methyltransferase 1